MFFTAFVLCILRIFKLKREGQKVYRKPHCKVTNLKSNFLLIPGSLNLALNNPAQELRLKAWLNLSTSYVHSTQFFRVCYSLVALVFCNVSLRFKAKKNLQRCGDAFSYKKNQRSKGTFTPPMTDVSCRSISLTPGDKFLLLPKHELTAEK